jgi:hypothetical protein
MQKLLRALVSVYDWLVVDRTVVLVAAVVTVTVGITAGTIALAWNVWLHGMVGAGTLSPLQCDGIGLLVTCLGLLQLDPIRCGQAARRWREARLRATR